MKPALSTLPAFLLAGLTACSSDSGDSQPPSRDAVLKANQALAVESNAEIDGLWFFAGNGRYDHVANFTSAEGIESNDLSGDVEIYGLLSMVLENEGQTLKVRMCDSNIGDFSKVSEHTYTMEEISDGNTTYHTISFNNTYSQFTHKLSLDAQQTVDNEEAQGSSTIRHHRTDEGFKVFHGDAADYQVNTDLTLDYVIDDNESLFSSQDMSVNCYAYTRWALKYDSRRNTPDEQLHAVSSGVEHDWRIQGTTAEGAHIRLNYENEPYQSVITENGEEPVEDSWRNQKIWFSWSHDRRGGAVTFDTRDDYTGTETSHDKQMLSGVLQVSDNADSSIRLTITAPLESDDL